MPPTPAVGSDPAGGSSCPATLALNEQDKKNLEQSLTLLQTNRQAAEKIYLPGITPGNNVDHADGSYVQDLASKEPPKRSGQDQ